jgi:hypothetical protein
MVVSDSSTILRMHGVQLFHYSHDHLVIFVRV